MAESEFTPAKAPSTRVLWTVGMSLVVLLLLALRAATIYSEAINWDEFALLKNAARSVASGELHAGGRPGLAVLLLLLVSGCADELAIVQNARLLWLALTFALVAGFAPAEHLISLRSCAKPERGYAFELIPAEANVIYGVSGDFFSLAPKRSFGETPLRKRALQFRHLHKNGGFKRYAVLALESLRERFGPEVARPSPRIGRLSS